MNRAMQQALAGSALGRISLHMDMLMRRSASKEAKKRSRQGIYREVCRLLRRKY